MSNLALGFETLTHNHLVWPILVKKLKVIHFPTIGTQYSVGVLISNPVMDFTICKLLVLYLGKFGPKIKNVPFLMAIGI